MENLQCFRGHDGRSVSLAKLVHGSTRGKKACIEEVGGGPARFEDEGTELENPLGKAEVEEIMKKSPGLHWTAPGFFPLFPQLHPFDGGVLGNMALNNHCFVAWLRVARHG